MADFEVRLEKISGTYISSYTTFYYGYTEDSVVKAIKRNAKKDHIIAFDIYYKDSRKPLGSWEKRGPRWYKV